jgi:uncharacterized repeat protein (TIGR03803 family)
MPFFKSIAVAAVSAIATLHVHTASAASELVIYSFMGAGGFDGSNPAGNLLNVGGTLYGTTLYGGSYNDGTAFSVTTRGVEKVLHTFHGGTDGSQPYDGLVHRHGVLYGTTYYGGDHGNGAIFSLTTGGVERVFNSFKSGTDGLEPAAGLVALNGAFYGTTLRGGNTFGGGISGDGVVFEMTKTGGERAIYSFQDGSDGAYPTAGLLNIGGTLYGTATGGGIGAGVVFKVTTAGVETAVYTFQGGTDGSNPAAGLINIGGTLYGTTVSGGNPDCEDEGCGTVFSVTTAGVKTVISTAAPTGPRPRRVSCSSATLSMAPPPPAAPTVSERYSRLPRQARRK